MGFFSKDIKTMDDLFVHTLRDIYYAENQIAEGAARHDREGDRRRSSSRPSRRISARPRTTWRGSSRCSRCTASKPKA